MSWNCTAESTSTQIQGALYGLNQVLEQYRKNNNGELPTSWSDLSQIIESGRPRSLASAEQYMGKSREDAIVLLTSDDLETRIHGIRVLAISTIPRDDGSYDALFEDPEALVRLSAKPIITIEQLKGFGIDTEDGLSVSDFAQASPKTSEGDPFISSASQSGEAPSGRGSSAIAPTEPSRTASRKWAYVVVAIALLSILAVVLRARKRNQ